MFNFSHANTLKIGDVAPNFELTDQHNNRHTLEQYQGQWVVLYFYPKNDTPGCTKQACAFRDDYKLISEKNTQVLGVSIDNSDSHADFAEKYNLPFPLLADNKGAVAKSYQAIISIGPLKFAKRHTFVIDPKGVIQAVYRKVDTNNHSQNILTDLKNLQQ